MRFKKKVTPEFGALRGRKFFCWLPTRIGDDTVWLETVAVEEMYLEETGWTFVREISLQSYNRSLFEKKNPPPKARTKEL